MPSDANDAATRGGNCGYKERKGGCLRGNAQKRRCLMPNLAWLGIGPAGAEPL